MYKDPSDIAPRNRRSAVLPRKLLAAAALAFALEQAHTLTDESTFMFYSDAETVVRALEQRFLKDQSVRPLFVKALTLYDELQNKFIKWIPRAENRAHDVAKQALLIG